MCRTRSPLSRSDRSALDLGGPAARVGATSVFSSLVKGHQRCELLKERFPICPISLTTKSKPRYDIALSTAGLYQSSTPTTPIHETCTGRCGDYRCLT